MNRLFMILIADDDANDRKLVEMALRRNGKPVEVREVTDGSEVIRYLRGEGQFDDRSKFPLPDLLLVDLKMPIMDGLQVIEALRKELEFVPFLIVMLSGSGLVKDIAEAYRLEANSYIQKPEDFSEYVKKLGIVIDYWLITEMVKSDGGFYP